MIQYHPTHGELEMDHFLRLFQGFSKAMMRAHSRPWPPSPLHAFARILPTPPPPLAACILNQCPLTVHRLEPGDITSSHNKTSFYPFPSSGVWYPALTNKTNTENYYCLQIIINHYHYVNNVPICIPFYNNTMSCTIYSNNSNVIQQTMKPMSGQTADLGWGGVKASLR